MSQAQDKNDFRSALAKFLRLYSFLTHIINLGDEKLYKFYAYGKCLYRKLPKEGEHTPDLNNDVVLQYYRLQKMQEGSINMAKEDALLNNATTSAGASFEDEKENLSKIIAQLNERLGTNFTEMDKVLEQFIKDMSANDELVLRSKNPLDLFKIIYDDAIMDIVLTV